MNTDQVLKAARRIIRERRECSVWKKQPRLNYTLLAKELGTTAYRLKKAMLIGGAVPPVVVRWGVGRPLKETGVLHEEIEWAVRKNTLRQQVGCSLKARVMAFN